MLLMGYEATWRTEQNHVANTMSWRRAQWNQEVRAVIWFHNLRCFLMDCALCDHWNYIKYILLGETEAAVILLSSLMLDSSTCGHIQLQGWYSVICKETTKPQLKVQLLYCIVQNLILLQTCSLYKILIWTALSHFMWISLVPWYNTSVASI